MIKRFTQTDLIRYLYRETTAEEKSEIDRALSHDGRLKALLQEARAALKGLDQATLEPSEAAISNILSYSRTLETKE